MAKLADAIALGAIGATLGGSNPLPPKKFLSGIAAPRVDLVTQRLLELRWCSPGGEIARSAQ
jgi:hypothetical protein